MILFPLEGCAPSQPDFPWERRSPDRLYIFTTEYTEKHGKYIFRTIIRQIKVREDGREGEPGTVRVSPANKTLFLPIRHRRLAGRDPTARRWSPKAKSIKPFRRPAFPGLTSLTSCSRACGMKLPFLILSILSIPVKSSCLSSASSVDNIFVSLIFSCFSCGSWLSG